MSRRTPQGAMDVHTLNFNRNVVFTNVIGSRVTTINNHMIRRKDVYESFSRHQDNLNVQRVIKQAIIDVMSVMTELRVIQYWSSEQVIARMSYRRDSIA